MTPGLVEAYGTPDSSGNGQRINIRAQADRLVAIATVDNRQHARSSESMNLVYGERLQALLNESLGAALGKPQFRIGMQISAPAHHLIL